MTGSVNGLASPDIRSIYARGNDGSACATGIPAFINLIKEGRNDPIAEFKLQPHQTDVARKYVQHLAQKNLPADFLQKELSPRGAKIRVLIGILYKDVQDSGKPEDIAKLDKVCKKLANANGIEKQEKKVEKDLSDLMSRYGAAACEKVINQNIEYCIEAWDEFHQANGGGHSGKTIFKTGLDSCKSVLDDLVEQLKQPDQSWITMSQTANYIVDCLTATTKTMKYHAKEPVTPDANGPEPVTPAAKGPEPLDPNKPDGAPDNQRFVIPTGPGQPPIHLQITNHGGSVGDINHSAGSTTAGPVDPAAAIIENILGSGLTNTEKVDVIKHLFQPHSLQIGSFLSKLAGVKGFKQENADDTQQVNVAKREIGTQTTQPSLRSIATQTEGGSETDNVSNAKIAPEITAQQTPITVVEQNKLNTAFDGGSSETQNARNLEGDKLDQGVLGAKSEQTVLSSTSNSDYVYTNTRMFDIFNRRHSAPTHFLPNDPQPNSERVGEKVVTMADKFEALKQRDPSAFDHLDRTQSASVQEDTPQPFSEHDVKKPVADNVTDRGLKSDAALDSAPQAQGFEASTAATQPRQTLNNASLAQQLAERLAPGNLNATGLTNTKTTKNATVSPTASGSRPEAALDSAPKQPELMAELTAAIQKRQIRNNASREKEPTESGVAKDLIGMSDSKTTANATGSSTNSRTLKPSSQGNPLSTHSVPADADTKPGKLNGKVVTLADKFESLKQRDPAAFTHLDDIDTVTSLSGKVKPTTEQDVEMTSTERSNSSERKSLLNPQAQDESSAADDATASVKMANLGKDSVDGGTLRKNSEQIDRKSLADGFQPARFNSEAVTTSVNKPANERVYTTVRTVDSWKRDPKPANFLPSASQSDVAKLNEVFSGLKQRDLSAFDAFDSKKLEQQNEKGQLPFQEKLAEFKRKGQLKATSHE